MRAGDGWNRDRNSPRHAGPSREDKVEVTRFVVEGEAAQALSSGPVEVSAAQDDTSDERELATYEAAVIDQLVQAGYETMKPDTSGGQVAELTISRSVVEPEEAPHRPVSGETEIGVSNRGSMMAMRLNIDLTKPAKALVSTRLAARIRDRASGEVLWEGRADIATRDGDDAWTDQAIATRLAQALFDDFPGRSGETLIVR
jgi:hypothetical protein